MCISFKSWICHKLFFTINLQKYLYNVNFLKSNQNRKIKITGHIHQANLKANEDAYDYKTKNNSLSANRAKAVYTYLLENEIDKERLSYQGMGSKFPRHQNPELDRRVEIVVVE